MQTSAPFCVSAVSALLGNVLQGYVSCSAAEEAEDVGGKWMWVI